MNKKKDIKQEKNQSTPSKKRAKKPAPMVDAPEEIPEGAVIPNDIDDDDAPKDLRGKKHSGRPSNAERAKTSSIDEQVNLLISDLITEIRNKRQTIPMDLKVRLLPALLGRMVRDDDQEDETELTMTVLGKKYLNEQRKVKSANQDARAEIQIHIAKVKGNRKHNPET